MRKIEQVLKTYLEESNSSSALMIAGEWGSGKTFFYKNTLQQIIKEFDFIPIYVSLNGVQNQDQLRKIILAKAILGTSSEKGKTKKKTLREKLKERITRAISNIDSIDPYISIFDISDFVELDNVIYCFDDLERISRDFPVEDLLGFISTEFVEHKNQKVLIIGDETKRQLAKEEYLKAKEKLIGWTITYKPNISEILNILLRKYQSNDKVRPFIDSHYGIIVKSIVGFDCQNLRTIIFFLDCLKKVILADIDCSESIQRDLTYFTFVICQEYKKGNLAAFKNKNKLPDIVTNRNQTNIQYPNDKKLIENIDKSGSKKSAEEIQVQEFEQTYVEYTYNKLTIVDENDLQYNYFESIYEFVTNGFLDVSKLKAEIDFYSTIRKDKKSPEQLDLITKLAYFKTLDNLEFERLFKKVLQEIKEGGLNIYEFARASEIILNLSHLKVIEQDETQILELLIENLSKTLDNTQIAYDGLNDLYVNDLFGNVKQRSERLYQELLLNHNNLRKTKLQEDVQHKFQNWKENIKDKELFRKVIENLDPVEVGKYIIDNWADREFLQYLIIQFGDSYRTINAGEYYYSHKMPISRIKRHIEDQELKLVDKFWRQILLNQLDDIMLHLEKTRLD